MKAETSRSASGLKDPNKDKVAAQAVRILIVDDHAIIRQGLKQILSDAFRQAVFGEAENGNQALEQVWKQPWEVVLLDITMPGKGGLEVLKQMVSAQPNMAVLVLSMHPEDQYAIRVLKTGAAATSPKTPLRRKSSGPSRKCSPAENMSAPPSRKISQPASMRCRNGRATRCFRIANTR